MTKREVMQRIDELRDLLSKPDCGLIDLRRAAERKVGVAGQEYLDVKGSCDLVKALIEWMLFGVYHRMGENDRACSCGQTFQSILPEMGWNAQCLAEDVEMPDGTWKVKHHCLDRPCVLLED